MWTHLVQRENAGRTNSTVGTSPSAFVLNVYKIGKYCLFVENSFYARMMHEKPLCKTVMAHLHENQHDNSLKPLQSAYLAGQQRKAFHAPVEPRICGEGVEAGKGVTLYLL